MGAHGRDHPQQQPAHRADRQDAGRHRHDRQRRREDHELSGSKADSGPVEDAVQRSGAPGGKQGIGRRLRSPGEEGQDPSSGSPSLDPIDVGTAPSDQSEADHRHHAPEDCHETHRIGPAPAEQPRVVNRHRESGGVLGGIDR